MVSLMGSHKGEQTRRRFQYEAKWSLEQGYNEVVSCEWEQPTGEGDQWHHVIHVEQKLAKCKLGISKW